MKAKMEFSLPEERSEFEVASHSLDLLDIISGMDNGLRDCIKHGSDKNKARVCEEIRKELWECINDHGVAHLFG